MSRIEAGNLTQVEVFEGLSREQVERIVAISRLEKCRRGAVIFPENAPGDSMYIVLDGEVEILVDPRILGEEVPPDTAPVPITVIRRGQSFGEVALVDAGVRSAAAVCRSPRAQLLVIGRDDFLHLCQEDTALGFRVMFNIAADLAGRIRTTDFMLRGRLLLAPRGR